MSSQLQPCVRGDGLIIHRAFSTTPSSWPSIPVFVLHNGIQPAPAATLFSILSQSDVMWALTSYINADPEARAWLNGKPDPWGMVVNPAYEGIKLPVESWPLLDTTTNGPDYTQSGNPFCVGALGNGKAKGSRSTADRQPPGDPCKSCVQHAVRDRRVPDQPATTTP